MSSHVKIGLYLAFAIGTAVFGVLFFRALAESDQPAAPVSIATATNQPSAATNVLAPEETAPSTSDTNAATERAAMVGSNTVAGTARRTGSLFKYGALLLFFVVGLSLMAAYDLSQLLGQKAEDFILSDDGEAMRDPEYEEAERLWADGRHLEAIQLMRDHLKRFPRQQYVALRIAEIYEKDLGNPLAAALEYEEVLMHKLEPERWGWAAIHLANLYSGKLNKTANAEAWLRRIVDDYGQTSAARKARERLGLPELPPEPPASASPSPDVPESNLPPGFRPKK